MKVRFLIPAVVVAVLFAFFWYALKGGDYDPQLIDSPLIGKAAPGFASASLADANVVVALKQFVGAPFVVNFWGTWCVGCREEHPQWLEIQKETTVPIVGIDWKDDHAAAIDWLKQLGDPYRVVATDDDGKIAIDWGVYGAPETFLVGADGKILHKHVGPMSVEIWRREFVKRLPAGMPR